MWGLILDAEPTRSRPLVISRCQLSLENAYFYSKHHRSPWYQCEAEDCKLFVINLVECSTYLGKGLGGSKLAQLSSSLQRLPSKKHILPPLN